MENEQKKSDNHKRIYIIIATVLLCAVVYSFVCGRNNAGTDQLYKSTDAAVDTIEKEHADVGRELDAAKGQLDSAGAAVGRADQLITASEERVKQIAASIAECQCIVGECREIVADSQRIYSEVEKANRARTGSSG